jgi:HAE1 family hydrophobic/amphiphilic exporter-1
VADIRLTEGPSEIRRIGQKRAAVISGNIDGRDMGAVAADIRREIRSLALPAGVSAFLSGQEEEMSRSLRSLLMAMGLAIFLVYLVMASQFESFLHPFVILFTIPLAAIGAVLALWITGSSVSVVVFIGLILLAGIVVNNAIVLVEYIEVQRDRGLSRPEAIVSAGRLRLRPILMATLTTVVGMLPLAMAIGEGSEMLQPLAVTIVSGLLFSMLVSLLLVPSVYRYLGRA